MQPGPSDNSLSFTQGSVAGFDSIYEKYHRAVYANILKTVRKPELAEDILQDVFVALWENRANIDEARVSNWIFVVSFNKSLSFLKKRAKESLMTNMESFNLEDIADEEPIDEDEVLMLLQILEKAIEKLPVRKREIFDLYRIQGLSLEEIGQRLCISVATVKDHLTLSNRQIRSYIQDNHNLSGILTAALYLLLESSLFAI